MIQKDLASADGDSRSYHHPCNAGFTNMENARIIHTERLPIRFHRMSGKPGKESQRGQCVLLRERKPKWQCRTKKLKVSRKQNLQTKAPDWETETKNQPGLQPVSPTGKTTLVLWSMFYYHMCWMLGTTRVNVVVLGFSLPWSYSLVDANSFPWIRKVFFMQLCLGIMYHFLIEHHI